MNLKFKRLKREQKSIRQLITVGALITTAGGTLAAVYILKWSWQVSFLFGTLVMVTGPTVITPLLRRLKVKRKVATVLEAEGVLIDAIGAIAATVALEAALGPAHAGFHTWMLHFATRFGFGALMGIAFGFLLVSLFSIHNLVPEGTENVFTLSMVLGLFHISNAVMPESGIAAVTIAGLVVGNFKTPITRELAEFKEELTVMLIGILFVLLAADVRMADVYALGLPGFATVLVIMFIARPLNVFVSTLGTDLDWKDKLFISWIGPRGIVAAAVASLFAVELGGHGVAGGDQLRAMVFMVITVTVLSAGGAGGLMARWLGLKRPTDSGWVILGANELARAVAKLFSLEGEETVLIDANPDACREAQNDCTRVIFGNGLKSRYILRAGIDTRAGVLAVTPNEEVNLLFTRKVKDETRLVRIYTTLVDASQSVTPDMIHRLNAQVLFGTACDVELWAVRIRRKLVRLQRWQAGNNPEKAEKSKPEWQILNDGSCIALVFKRSQRLLPYGDGIRIRAGDEIILLAYSEQADHVTEFFEKNRWQRVSSEDEELFTTSLCRLPREI